jgi:hypothetical protein
MKCNRLLLIVTFVIGLSAGWVVRPRHSPGAAGMHINPAEPLTIYQIDPPGDPTRHYKLVPHSYSVGNTVRSIVDRPPNRPVWLVNLANGRIIIACTLDPAP